MVRLVPESVDGGAFITFLRNLLVADWEQLDGLIQLSGDLKLDDLADADFFVNIRIFLAALAEEDGTLATATGNLNRAFASHMFERLKLPKYYRDSIRHVCKVINEMDIWPLHIVRVVSECAGLVARRRKHFHLTKAGRLLLPDDRAGVLFRKLFVAYFRRFDLSYDFQLRDVPGIQDTIAFILWRLDTVARDWVSVRGIALDILLPGVLGQLRQAMTFPHDSEEWILAGYVLDPLLGLGLIERQRISEWASVTEEDAIRVTTLWRKFIGFRTKTFPPASLPYPIPRL